MLPYSISYGQNNIQFIPCSLATESNIQRSRLIANTYIREVKTQRELDRKPFLPGKT